VQRTGRQKSQRYEVRQNHTYFSLPGFDGDLSHFSAPALTHAMQKSEFDFTNLPPAPLFKEGCKTKPLSRAGYAGACFSPIPSFKEGSETSIAQR